MQGHNSTATGSSRAESEMLESGVGLCLSGGGYRAMLFHLGVIWRLVELGYPSAADRFGKFGPMGSLKCISSVSGGSITTGVLGLAWNKLRVDELGLPERFRQYVSDPIQTFASKTTVGIISGLWAMIVSTVNKKGRLMGTYIKI